MRRQDLKNSIKSVKILIIRLGSAQLTLLVVRQKNIHGWALNLVPRSAKGQEADLEFSTATRAAIQERR